MNQLNTLIIEGNVVRDCECRTVSDDKKLSTFTIACNRSTRMRDGTWAESASYFDCEAWGQVAEIAEKNALKGTKVRISGRIAQNVWTDSEEKRHSQVRIVCEHVEYSPKPSKKDGKEDRTETAPKAETEQEENFSCSF